jgi:hypothetical protein
MNNNKGTGAGIFAFIIIVLVVLVIIAVCSGSDSSSSSSSSYKQKEALESAYNKTKNGQSLSPTEQREWDSYQKWEQKQYDSKYYK